MLAGPPPKRNRLNLSGASFAPRAPKELLLCARGVRRAFLDARILCLLKPLPGVSIGPRPSAITSLTVHVCRWQVFKHYWSRNGAMPFDGPCILLGPCCAVFQAANHCRLRFCVLVRRLDRASFNCDAHACRLCPTRCMFASRGVACHGMSIKASNSMYFTCGIANIDQCGSGEHLGGTRGVATRPKFSLVTDFG